MSVFFNAAILKALFLVLVTLFTAIPRNIVTHSIEQNPLIRITISLDREEAKEDTAATKKSEKAEKPEKAEKKAKGEKPVKIEITDQGIKIIAEGEDKFILEFDAEELQKSLLELEEAIREGLPEEMEELQGIILDELEEEEGRRFYKDRGRDLIKFGESLHIGKYEKVRGDLVSIGGDITVEGKVMGSVVSVFGDIELESTAIVNGDVVCVLGDLSRDDGARIRGEIVSVGPESPKFNWILPGIGRGAFKLMTRIIVFIIGVLLLGIVTAFLSDRMKRSSTHVFGSFFKSLGVGILVLIVGSLVVGIIAAILSITIIGIPVAVLVVISFGVLLLLGYFVSALALGKAAAHKFNVQSESLFVQGVIGLFLLTLLGLITGLMYFNPFLGHFRIVLKSIGGFINLLALLTGVGAFIISKAGGISAEKKPAPPE